MSQPLRGWTSRNSWLSSRQPCRGAAARRTSASAAFPWRWRSSWTWALRRRAPGRPWRALQAGAALALLAVGVPSVVAIFGVQGGRWDWARAVRDVVFALDADAAGQHQWRQLARQAALRGKRVGVLEPAAYGGYKDASEAWAAGVLHLDAGSAAIAGVQGFAVPEELREVWAERAAIMAADGGLPPGEAEHLAWVGLQALKAERRIGNG